MKVEVEELTPLKRTLKVEVPGEVVSRELAAAYAQLNRRVHIPGFRPGKAPQALLERRYAREIEEDLTRRLVTQYYHEALQQAGLRPAVTPSFVPTRLEKDTPFRFTATVEIKPKIELADYRALPLPPLEVQIPEERVEEALAALRDEHAPLESVAEDRPVEKGDFVTVVVVPAEPQASAGETLLLEVGRGKLLPEFEAALLGARKGQEVTVVLPARDGGPTGREVRLKVQDLKRKLLPAIDEEFAKDLGYPDLATLRERVREGVHRVLAREALARRREEAGKLLVERHRVEAPETLVERELERMLRRMARDLREAGKAKEEIQKELAVAQPETRAIAADRVRLSLILEAIAEREGLEVTDAELRGQVERIAAEMKAAPEDVARLLIAQDGSLDGLRAKILEEKALDRVAAPGIEQKGERNVGS